MKIVNWIQRGPSSLLLAFLLWGSSCTPEKIDFNSSDSANVESETTSDTYFSDAEDMSNVTVSSDKATNGGRIAEGSWIIKPRDPRLECATITLVPANGSTHSVPKGVLTIDFGAGCTDDHGTIRKGKIMIVYNGRRFLPGSSVVTTLDGYEINGIKVEGVRSVANSSNSTQSDPRFTTTMTGGMITWPDGTTASRDESITREWKLGAATIDSQWLVTGSATGKNRHNQDYSMTITETLLYKKECAVFNKVFMAVKGIKELVTADKKVTIDYGNGTCDKLVTITINGKSKVVELGNN